ncbi:MAG TPA: hypothetical protein PKO18_04455, partial [Chitinophagales bacterium]|nr:hypothetical protein [Chitinophagales bacterium]
DSARSSQQILLDSLNKIRAIKDSIIKAKLKADSIKTATLKKADAEKLKKQQEKRKADSLLKIQQQGILPKNE